MNIIFDIGNTNTKVAVVDGSGIVFASRLKRLSASKTEKILKPYSKQVKKAIISSTREIPDFLISFLSSFADITILSSKTKLPFTIKYDTPNTLGTDRLAGVAGALASFPGENILVIDAGSAITFDYIIDNQFIGGNISLGINMRFKALHKFTSKLPLVVPTDCPTTPGRSTDEAITAGVIFGVVYEINEYIRTFLEAYPGGKIILTGGDGEYLKERLRYQVIYIPDIVITGLNFILQNDAE